ncbi:MAG: hypothetical protein ABSD08_02065 [Xanthobacteraceae bacterium]
MIMSALYAVMLEKRFEAKAFVVAGSLYVDDKRIFGEDSNVDGQTFSKSNPSWDGHGWLAVGDFIADISVGRTARSGKCSPLLTERVIRQFGPNSGLVVCKPTAIENDGLFYRPQYVLVQDQVDALARGAIAKATGSI